MNEKLIDEIVDYMVKYGTEHTNYGNWYFDIPELCEMFELEPEWFYENNDAIVDELYNREEVLDVEQEFDSDGHPLHYDVNYGTGYCGLEED